MDRVGVSLERERLLKPFDLKDYLAEREPVLPTVHRSKPKRKVAAYYRIDAESARVAQSLGGNCLWVFMNIIKRSHQLQRVRDWIWIDDAFIESVELCQRTVRRCVHKLASVGLVGVTSIKGRFLKVTILNGGCES